MTNGDNIGLFANFCISARAVYVHFKALFESASDADRARMEAMLPIFLSDVASVFREYIILQVCKATDPAQVGGRENLTAPFLLEYYSDAVGDARGRLTHLNEQMQEFRKKILPARHKIISHIDRSTAHVGEPLGQAPQEEWDAFWVNLDEFISIIFQNVRGDPLNILEVGFMSDADSLLKYLQFSKSYLDMLNGSDEYLARKCAELLEQ